MSNPQTLLCLTPASQNLIAPTHTHVVERTNDLSQAGTAYNFWKRTAQSKTILATLTNPATLGVEYWVSKSGFPF